MNKMESKNADGRKPDIYGMAKELLEQGWTKWKNHFTLWRSPDGRYYRGPALAWHIMKGLPFPAIALLLSLLGCTPQPLAVKQNHIPQGYVWIDENTLNIVAKREGTNFLGVYMGMIAVGAKTDYWGNAGRCVVLASATSGEVLRWISYDEFVAVYIKKTKTEYPRK